MTPVANVINLKHSGFRKKYSKYFYFYYYLCLPSSYIYSLLSVCSPVHEAFSPINLDATSRKINPNSFNPVPQSPPSPSFNFVPTPHNNCKCTQDAIKLVDREISDFKASIQSTQISSSHREVLRMGEEVRQLRKETNILKVKLDKSDKRCEYLTNRLNFFEVMHEDNLVKESIEYENDKDMFARHQRYSQYAPKNFSKDFNPHNNRSKKKYY